MTDLKSNNEFDSLEAFFHERLKDASFAPPQGPWAQIEEELDLLEKQKRKRRFLWFFTSGLVLLCGLASLWFFVLSDKSAPNTFMAEKNRAVLPVEKKKLNQEKNVVNTSNENNNTATETPNKAKEEKTETTNSLAENKATEKTVSLENAPATVISESNKIQLAACSKKANPAIFNKVPYKVIEVKSNDGYVRYFAETSGNKEDALNTIHNSGFAKAFVKKNFNSNDESSVVKNEGVVETEPSIYVATNTSLQKRKTVSAQNNTVIASVKNNTETKSVNTKTENKTSKTNPATNEAVVTNSSPAKTGNSNSTPVTTNSTTTGNNNNANSNAVNTSAENQATNNTAVVETKTEEVKIPSAENNTKTDSIPTQIVANETKIDSLPAKTQPIDSAKTAATYTTPDTFTPEWAILLLAGPNIFSQNAQSSLFVTSNEQQTPSVNAEAKIQFKPFKKFSFSAGVNYNQFIVNQGNPVTFLFNKNQKDDYILYSSHGPMAVPMSVLLDGFYTGVPFDTFKTKYTYTSKLNVISIPLEANFHFLNKSKFSLFAGIGANSSFVLSQQTKLSIIKENFTNEVSYNNITVNKFNISMLFSLGCDIRLGKRLYLTLVPSYRYGITNMSATSGTTFSPAYFSGNAGLKFKF